MTRDWDAASYDRIADPQARWGSSVLERLPLAGSERVLDAGCGSGRVTEQLLARLPNGSVVALDASQQMVAEARRRLARFDGQVEYVVADLGQPLPIGPVDAVFSTAAFHWVPDHDALFRNLAAVLPPGGPLVAQCGGAGNIKSVLAILDDLDPDGRLARPWTFATPAATSTRLTAAGFRDVETWLTNEPTTIPADTLAEFLRTVVLGATLDGLPEPEREPLVRAVASRLPDGLLDYVRLNIVARRA